MSRIDNFSNFCAFFSVFLCRRLFISQCFPAIHCLSLSLPTSLFFLWATLCLILPSDMPHSSFYRTRYFHSTFLCRTDTPSSYNIYIHLIYPFSLCLHSIRNCISQFLPCHARFICISFNNSQKENPNWAAAIFMTLMFYFSFAIYSLPLFIFFPFKSICFSHCFLYVCVCVNWDAMWTLSLTLCLVICLWSRFRFLFLFVRFVIFCFNCSRAYFALFSLRFSRMQSKNSTYIFLLCTTRGNSLSLLLLLLLLWPALLNLQLNCCSVSNEKREQRERESETESSDKQIAKRKTKLNK